VSPRFFFFGVSRSTASTKTRSIQQHGTTIIEAVQRIASMREATENRKVNEAKYNKAIAERDEARNQADRAIKQILLCHEIMNQMAAVIEELLDAALIDHPEFNQTARYTRALNLVAKIKEITSRHARDF
jgi:hypothetical protein